MCKHSQPKWHCHFGSSSLDRFSVKIAKTRSPLSVSIAMASMSMEFDTIVPEESQGPMPAAVAAETCGGSDER